MYTANQKQNNLLQNAAGGFSLLELLFLLVLLSLVMLFGLVVMNKSDRYQLLENFAHQLEIQMSLAHEEAVLHNQNFALVKQNNGYQFYYLASGAPGGWCPINSDPYLYRTVLPSDFLLEINFAQDALADKFFNYQPHVTFYQAGNITPFTIDMGIKNSIPGYRITGVANGNISIVNLSVNPLGFTFH